MAVVITKTLRAFAKHEGSDVVSFKVTTRVENDGVLVAEQSRTEWGSDTALQAAAAPGNWDEDTVCAVHGYVRPGVE
jgi:hypothetical protein